MVLHDEFRRKIKSIFRNNLLFGFVCGSAARNEISERSDIDMFVCTKKRKNAKDFVKWYVAIHRKYKKKLDQDFPGEVVFVNELDKKLKLASKSKPSFMLHNKDLYDGIVWAGMLSGAHIGFVGNKSEFKLRRKFAKKIVNNWARKLLGQLKNQPDKLLKAAITYSIWIK